MGMAYTINTFLVIKITKVWSWPLMFIWSTGLIMYRVAEKSPSPDQYATIIWFGLLTYTWLLVHWIRMCTLMLDTQTDAPPCPLWHTSEHFWSNCAKDVFHSSAQICRHPTVHSRKLGDTASHSSLSSCGLALLTVAHQALTIISVSTSLGNVQWKWQPLHTFPSALSFSHSAACL